MFKKKKLIVCHIVNSVSADIEICQSKIYDMASELLFVATRVLLLCL